VTGKTDPPCSGMITSDKSEIAFLKSGRDLPPQAQAVLSPFIWAVTTTSVRASIAKWRPMSSVRRSRLLRLLSRLIAALQFIAIPVGNMTSLAPDKHLRFPPLHRRWDEFPEQV
jgi:hypothetical protein